MANPWLLIAAGALLMADPWLLIAAGAWGEAASGEVAA